MQKLCPSTKLPHKEIRWTYDILRSVLRLLYLQCRSYVHPQFKKYAHHILLLILSKFKRIDWLLFLWNYQKIIGLLMISGEKFVNSLTLRKIPKFHLISWCGDFLERHSFCIVSDDFHTMKLCEITAFYAVLN